MYVLVASIRETGGIDLIIRYVLGAHLQTRAGCFVGWVLLLPVASLSAFLNNTPVVADLYTGGYELESAAATLLPSGC